MQPIPDDVQRFVLTSIPSVPYLEAALLMRESPEKWWTAAQVAARLYIREAAAAELLAALYAAGLVQRQAADTSKYRFEPRDAGLAESITAVATCYRDNLFGVTALIHDAIQKNAIRFADAFKIRKDP